MRLVKGAYWDHEIVEARQNGWGAPVFADKAASDRNFEHLTAWLIDRREAPALTSTATCARSRACWRSAAIAACPSARLEFQMLYGMAEPLQAALVARGERLRLYCPFGELLPGMAYLVRRLLENTSNQSFVRAGFLNIFPEERLLMDPRHRPAEARDRAHRPLRQRGAARPDAARPARRLRRRPGDGREEPRPRISAGDRRTSATARRWLNAPSQARGSW